MEFKVGQKVRVKENFTFTKDVVGKVGVIKFVRDNGKTLAVEFDLPYRLCHDCDGKCAPKRGLWLSPSSGNFELVPEPKFKVGDKIVYEGKRGKVYIVNEDFVHLRLDENEDIMYGCSDNLVEKLEDVQLQKGDTVKAINNEDGRKLVGEIGKVIDIHGDCISVEFFNFIDGHSCLGASINDGHCWNMTRKNVEFLKREPVKLGNRFQRGARYRYVGSEFKDKYGELCILGMNGDYWKNVRFNDGTFYDCKPEDLIEPDKDFEWKTGAVVKVVKEVDDYIELKPRQGSLVGKKGIIVDEIPSMNIIGVQFFDDIHGHDCDGKGKDRHCWKIKKDELEYVGVEHDKEEKVKGEEKIMFNVGDVVIYVGDGYPSRKGQTGKVVEKDCGGKAYLVNFADGINLWVEKIKRKVDAAKLLTVISKKYTIKDIVGIYPNEEKRVVVVKFNDSEEPIRVNCSADDNFDLTIAVALAIAYKNAGSKNQFKKKIAEKTKVIKSKPKKEVNPEHFGFGFITSADADEEVTSSDLEEVAKEAFDNMFVESNKALNDFLNIGLTYGQRLHRARKEKKLNQADVAKLVGTVPSTISDWERGKYMPKPDKRKILEKVLGI